MPRPKKPSRLKILQGTARRDRMNPNEPQFPQGIDPPPDWLTEESRKVWERLVGPLTAAGLLTLPDWHMFAVFCSCYGEFVEAQKAGLAISAARTAQLRSLAGVFGLEPAARSKLHVPDPPKKSEWDDL